MIIHSRISIINDNRYHDNHYHDNSTSQFPVEILHCINILIVLKIFRIIGEYFTKPSPIIKTYVSYKFI